MVCNILIFSINLQISLVMTQYLALSWCLCVFQMFIIQSKLFECTHFSNLLGGVGFRLFWIQSERSGDIQTEECPGKDNALHCLKFHCIKQELLRARPALTLPEKEGAFMGSQKLDPRSYYSSSSGWWLRERSGETADRKGQIKAF